MFRFIAIAALALATALPAQSVDSLKALSDSLKDREVVLVSQAFGRFISERPALMASLNAIRAAQIREAREREARARDVFFTALAVPIFANSISHFNEDVGGYVDPWNSQDKHYHAAVASALTLWGAAFGVNPVVSALGVCGAAGLWEASQGYASIKDFTWGCGSALLTGVIKKLL